MADEAAVTGCPAEGEWFGQVLQLSKLAKTTVGFLPDTAFRDRAERDTLLVAVERDRVLAYVLYDLPRDEVRIRQLVTSPEHVGRGLARRLVAELHARHPARQGIFLECRRDFPVSRMWPKLGFVPIEERTGRSYAGLPLTIWFRDFGHPNLLTLLAEPGERPIAAFDTNIVIDLSDNVTTTAERLNSEWIMNTIRVGLTDHVLLEVDAHGDAAIRSRRRAFAASLPRLSSPTETWRGYLDQLRAVHPLAENMDGDFHHAAKAAAAGARWLVTRDGRFSRAYRESVRDICAVDVVSPGELLTAVDAIVRDDSYRPTDLAGSALEFRDLHARELEAVAREFVGQREGEELSRLRGHLERIAIDVGNTRIRVLLDGSERLGVLATRTHSTYDIELCRVRGSGRGDTVARQLVAIARMEAADPRFAAARLVDAHCGESVRKAARREGFLPVGGAFIAMPISGVGSRDALEATVVDRIQQLGLVDIPTEFRTVTAVSTAATAAETLFHPWRVLNGGLDTFVLSIEPAWAAELFDTELARSSLIPRRAGLTLQREHVYYRSPTAGGGLRAPARILWYVKAGPANRRGIRAISTLRDVTIGSPQQLYRRFQHLGVYNADNVNAAARDGRVMALRFDHTTLLPSPISLERYREAMNVAGSGVNLQGPQRIPEQVFDQLLSLAHG